ncbi:hypothetical protein EIP86_005513 [Pleurotus ostreatoroseus]|nr:hypothetical protein EIP86_005513 [Pleurotus ostreatoroseus]
MSLDQNLFTLLFAPSKDDPNVTDLVDLSENPHYRKERVIGETYRINVYDPLSQSLLASATAPHATSKHKTIELHNPSKTVELKYTGTLTFKWRFQWEEHEFEWKREESFIIRKPDPAVLVAITKEAAGRLKTSSVQILDYNLNRFDIQDRKGLEIVILTALLTFQDSNDAYHTPSPNPTSTSDSTPTVVATADLSRTRPLPPLHTRPSFFGVSRRGSDEKRATAALATQFGELQLTPDAPPALPPKPAPRAGVERIAEMHAVRVASGEGEANEVIVDNEGSVEEYARYVEGMLKDGAILFVTIRSANATEVPKVLQVVEETKRLRYKSGIDEDEPLHQYVVYDTAQAKRKGPRRINLDDPNSSTSTTKAYAPPTSLSIHLSKIDMPELQPRPESKVERPSPTPQPQLTTPLDKYGYPDSKSDMLAWEREQERLIMSGRQREKDREREKAKEREREKEMEKVRKKAEKEAKKAAKGKKGMI